MKKALLAVAFLSSAGFIVAMSAQSGATAAPAPAPGTAEAGRAFWAGNRSQCRNCHGMAGEGAFGPNLAGRGLNVDEFTRAVRTPWGVMPAYTEPQVSDQDIAGLTAYFASLPKATPGPWQTLVPANAPSGQAALIATAGCGQCHGPELANPRQDAGGEGADFAWFAKNVYEHTTNYPNGRMGNFSRARLPESVLQDIWHFASVDLGLRPFVRVQVSPGTPAGANTSYTLTLTNAGVAGKGLIADDLSVSVTLPKGSTVERSSPDRGYSGVYYDDPTDAETAVWNSQKLAPGETLTFTLVLANTTAPLRGEVHWTKPRPDTVAFAGRGIGAGPAVPAGGGPAGRGGRGQ